MVVRLEGGEEMSELRSKPVAAEMAAASSMNMHEVFELHFPLCFSQILSFARRRVCFLFFFVFYVFFSDEKKVCSSSRFSELHSL